MSQNFEDELNREERQALNSLPRERVPPAYLEERVVETLKQSILLRCSEPFWRGSAARIGMAVAASLLVFVLGTVAGVKWASRTTAPNSPQFMLVLRAGTQHSRPRSSEEVMRIVKEYGNWASQLRQQGVRVEGEKLKQEARVLREVEGRPLSNNRLGADQDTIGGYFVIEARDYEQAVTLATGCPHLKYGGTIEVRQIDKF